MRNSISSSEKRRRAIAALNEEENEKRGKMERIIQEGILSLSDRVTELEDNIEDDGISFLQVGSQIWL